MCRILVLLHLFAALLLVGAGKAADPCNDLGVKAGARVGFNSLTTSILCAVVGRPALVLGLIVLADALTKHINISCLMHHLELGVSSWVSYLGIVTTRVVTILLAGSTRGWETSGFHIIEPVLNDLAMRGNLLQEDALFTATAGHKRLKD